MIVDFHTHIVPDAFPATGGAEVLWPSMKHHGDGRADVMIAGKVYRKIDERSWAVAPRMVDMDRDGIDVQVLSPMPELLSYWFSPEDGGVICDAVNGHINAMVADAPTRFRGIGMVPMQDPKLAATHLKKLHDSGMIGALIGSHIEGLPLGDASLDPFYQTAQDLGMLVMVHAMHPAGMDRVGGPAGLAGTVAFPLETALAASSLIVGGVMERFSDLKLMLCHGGGALMSLLPRLDFAWHKGMSIASAVSVPPSEIARRFFFDSIVYSDDSLNTLIDRVGGDRVVMGTDYPFAIMQTDPVNFISGASAGHAPAILAGTPFDLARKTRI